MAIHVFVLKKGVSVKRILLVGLVHAKMNLRVYVITIMNVYVRKVKSVKKFNVMIRAVYA